MLNILSWFFILFWLSMVYRFCYHGYKVLASICLYQPNHLHQTIESHWGINPNIVVCEDIGLKILFAMYNHHNLAKENRSEQEILVAGTQFAQNNKQLFKELSHQNEHFQRKWATLPMYICYIFRYIKNQLLMPLLQHIRHSRKTMPNISWWKRTCCWPSTLYL